MMNPVAKKIIMNRMRQGGEDERDYRDYEDSRRGDYRDYQNGASDYEMDGRRGVKYTGRYGIGGRDHNDMQDNGDDRRRDYRDYEGGGDSAKRGRLRYDYENDYEGADYEMDGAMKMPKRDMEKWKHSLKNEDGTQGEHFKKEQIEQMADKLGVEYEHYDEKDFCMVVNMLYSDYCEALKGVFSPEKELMVYVKMAKAWLEDKDAAAKGSEKLMVYYYGIVDKGEEDHRRGRR